MKSPASEPAGPQAVQFSRVITGKPVVKIPRCLKAKHLAHSTRELIVRLFISLESHEDVAREMNMPGLTGKTVAEVLDAWQMKRPPASSRQAFNVETPPTVRAFRSAGAA